MKQKLFLLLMLVVALAACTKDDEHDDYMSAAPPTNPTESSTSSNNDSEKLVSELGTFEGEWILDQKVISQPDIIVVRDEFINLYIPDEIPLLKALEAIGMGKGEYIPMTIPRLIRRELQGTSENKAYYNLGFADVVGDSGSATAIYGRVFLYGNYSENNISIHLFTNQPNVGIYDFETGLWTLKITISQIYVESGTVNIYDLPSPLVLLFVAKKRL
jgi:hypothetical protein